MLTEAQFKILKTVYLCSEQTLTQRALAAQTDMSLGKVNQTVSALTEAGLLAGGRVTDAGEGGACALPRKKRRDYGGGHEHALRPALV